MGQPSLIYSFVARGTVNFAAYTEFAGNFRSVAFQCLQKLPAINKNFTYSCNGHTFNFLIDDGFSELTYFDSFLDLTPLLFFLPPIYALIVVLLLFSCLI